MISKTVLETPPERFDEKAFQEVLHHDPNSVIAVGRNEQALMTLVAYQGKFWWLADEVVRQGSIKMTDLSQKRVIDSLLAAGDTGPVSGVPLTPAKDPL